MNIEIIEFNTYYAKYFSALNIAWLQKYFVVEPIDKEMLSDPEKYIIHKNGFVFFAKVDDTIAGTFALIKISDGIYELSKMAVDDAFQGNKVGNRMLEFCIKKATEINAGKVILYSNTRLEPAIHLYKKFGFREVPLGHTEYERANIKMEINIRSHE